jgi:uncharacterized protein (DUF697 family)
MSERVIDPQIVDADVRLRPEGRVEVIVGRYTWAAAGAMFAVPVPGADILATFAVWGAMIREIARAYGEEISLEDGARLASELFRGVVLTLFAWFGSAQIAASALKVVPGAGTLTAYAVDAAIAAVGAKRITRAVGTAAALYYGSGKTMSPPALRAEVRRLMSDPSFWRQALSAFGQFRRPVR